MLSFEFIKMLFQLQMYRLFILYFSLEARNVAEMKVYVYHMQKDIEYNSAENNC